MRFALSIAPLPLLAIGAGVLIWRNIQKTEKAAVAEAEAGKAV